MYVIVNSDHAEPRWSGRLRAGGFDHGVQFGRTCLREVDKMCLPCIPICCLPTAGGLRSSARLLFQASPDSRVPKPSNFSVQNGVR